jgi:hypothetical protein
MRMLMSGQFKGDGVRVGIARAKLLVALHATQVVSILPQQLQQLIRVNGRAELAMHAGDCQVVNQLGIFNGDTPGCCAVRWRHPNASGR